MIARMPIVIAKERSTISATMLPGRTPAALSSRASWLTRSFSCAYVKVLTPKTVSWSQITAVRSGCAAICASISCGNVASFGNGASVRLKRAISALIDEDFSKEVLVNLRGALDDLEDLCVAVIARNRGARVAARCSADLHRVGCGARRRPRSEVLRDQGLLEGLGKMLVLRMAGVVAQQARRLQV